MIEVLISKTFKKLLIKIPNTDQKHIIEKITSLESEDDNLDIKKMQPKHLNYYRLRVGKYRIIYQYQTTKIIILLKVDKRDDIYFNI